MEVWRQVPSVPLAMMITRLARRVVAKQHHAFSAYADASSEGCQGTFVRRGYVPFATPNAVLNQATVERVQSRLPLLFRGDFDTGVYPDEMHWREGISKDDAPREIVNAWKADRTIAAVVLAEHLGRLAATIAGWQSARVAQDDIVWKPPGSGPVAYHQDSAYISTQFVPLNTKYENNSVTVWMPLDDCDRKVGTIEYATFTDRLKPGELPTIPSGPSSTPSFHGATGLNYRAPAEAAGRKLGRGVEFDPVAVPAGGCVVHGQDCWHGSAPNVSTHRHRRALVVHFLRGDVNFIEGHSLEGTGGPSYIYSRYKRIGSTEVSEEAFPITFSQGGYRTPWIEAYLGEKASQAMTDAPVTR